MTRVRPRHGCKIESITIGLLLLSYHCALVYMFWLSFRTIAVSFHVGIRNYYVLADPANAVLP